MKQLIFPRRLLDARPIYCARHSSYFRSSCGSLCGCCTAHVSQPCALCISFSLVKQPGLVLREITGVQLICGACRFTCTGRRNERRAGSKGSRSRKQSGRRPKERRFLPLHLHPTGVENDDRSCTWLKGFASGVWPCQCIR